MRETRLSDLKNEDRAKILRIEDSLPRDELQRLRESGVSEFLLRGIVCERLDATIDKGSL